MDAAQIRAHFGVDRLPHPLDHQAFTQSLQHHHPRALARASGYVVLDVAIDELGAVGDVDVVAMPVPQPRIQAVRLERDPRTGKMVERQIHPGTHPEFGPAAQAALREIRFAPAIRDGKAVPFTLRMTIHFSPRT